MTNCTVSNPFSVFNAPDCDSVDAKIVAIGPFAVYVHTPVPLGIAPPLNEHVPLTSPKLLLLLYSHVDGPCVMESGMHSEICQEEAKVPDWAAGVGLGVAVVEGHTFS